LSKLFDQLKKAARTREEKSPGLLLEALRSQGAAPAAAVTPAQAGAQSPAATPAQGAQSSHKPFPYAGIIVAAAILGIVVLAWNANPWRVPARVKIDPSGLKLERNLDLQRPPSKGTSPAARPS